MKSLAQYYKEVLKVVMNDLKNGVSGSTTADTLVRDYGFDRKTALGIIVRTMILLG